MKKENIERVTKRRNVLGSWWIFEYFVDKNSGRELALIKEKSNRLYEVSINTGTRFSFSNYDNAVKYMYNRVCKNNPAKVLTRAY